MHLRVDIILGYGCHRLEGWHHGHESLWVIEHHHSIAHGVHHVHVHPHCHVVHYVEPFHYLPVLVVLVEVEAVDRGEKTETVWPVAFVKFGCVTDANC